MSAAQAGDQSHRGADHCRIKLCTRASQRILRGQRQGRDLRCPTAPLPRLPVLRPLRKVPRPDYPQRTLRRLDLVLAQRKATPSALVRPRDPRTALQRQCRARLAAAVEAVQPGAGPTPSRRPVSPPAPGCRAAHACAQSGPLDGQQYWVRRNAPEAARACAVVSTFAKPLANTEDSASTWERRRVVPVCHRGRAVGGRPCRCGV